MSIRLLHVQREASCRGHVKVKQSQSFFVFFFGGWGWGVGVVYYFLLGSGPPCLEHPSLLQPMLWFCLAVQLFYKSLFLLSPAVSRLPKPHQRHWKLYAHFSFLLIDCKRLHRYLVRKRERGTKFFFKSLFSLHRTAL